MPRKTKIVTTCMNGRLGPTIEDNRDRVLALLDTACGMGPDIVCLPETFASAGCDLPIEQKAETVPGPTTDACAERARKHRTNVICPILTRRDGAVFNSAVVIDRAGAVVGIYDKVQPVTSRWDMTVTEKGVTPGNDAPVFELDCGRIGIQICFDIEFPETWQQLEDAGAELVFWPSAYDGGFPLLGYAYRHSYYVVSSVRTTHSRIINPLGEVLDHTSSQTPLAARTIDLDYIVCHTDFHFGLLEEMVRAHGAGVTVRALREEGKFMAESNLDDVPLAKLIEQFGLTSRRQYADAHRAAHAELRQGRAPKPQRPPFAGREPYTQTTLDEFNRMRSALG